MDFHRLEGSYRNFVMRKQKYLNLGKDGISGARPEGGKDLFRKDEVVYYLDSL